MKVICADSCAETRCMVNFLLNLAACQSYSDGNTWRRKQKACLPQRSCSGSLSKKGHKICKP